MAESDKTATVEVADDDLSKAWDTAAEPEVKTEPVAEETKSPEETPKEEVVAEISEVSEEELDHKDKSKLGRKLKSVNDQLATVMAELAALKSGTTPVKNENEIVMPEVISTPDDIRQFMQAEKQREQQAKTVYEQSYMKQVTSLQDANEYLHDEIFAEMMQNFNVKHTDNAFADARINYAEAKASVLTKKYESGKPNLPKRDTATKPPVQPAAGAQRSVQKPLSLPPLDEEAKNYVAYLKKNGMSDEDIAKELT